MTASNTSPDVSSDNRSQIYAFSKLSELKKYFGQFYPIDEINDVIENSKVNFKIRKNTSKKETQLQFIRKCEVALMTKLRQSS